MMGIHEFSTAEVRRLVSELRALGQEQAPASLLPGVLRGLGLGDAYTTVESPLGVVYVAFNARGISMVTRAESSVAFERAFLERFGRTIYAAEALPAPLARVVAGEAGARAAARFDLCGLSEFERAVLLKALEIPRGEVRPYSWIAREIGAPRAVRAVGTALGHNPVPLLIPCHRVIRSDGQIGNYSLGGPAAKRSVLAAEGVDPEALERLARAGVRYHGSDSTHIYCFPTCRHARRTGDAHRVAFSSESQAQAAGYRPCRVCRPAAAS